MVKRSGFFGFAFFLFMLFLLFSCKKDEDSPAPVISIQKPYENATFGVYDKIPVKASISDDQLIESVEISLYSQDNRKVGKTQAYHVGASSFQLDVTYSIIDSLIPSASYYIRIHAYDGNKIAYAFRNINISSLEKRKLYTLILASSVSSASIYAMDEQNNFSNKNDFNFPHHLSAVSSLKKTLFIADKTTNTMHGYDLENDLIKWGKVYPAANSTSEINDLSIAEGTNAAISLQTGYMEIISADGNLIKNYNTQVGMHPLRHFIAGDLTFLETFSNNRNAHQLEVFHSASGGSFDLKNIDFETMGIYEAGNSKYLFFVNKSGKAWLMEYSAQSKTITTVDELHNDSIEQLIRINENEFVFGSSAGVYKYMKNSGSTLTFVGGISADALAFDPFGKEVYIASDQQLYIYDYSSGQQKSAVSFPKNIVEIYPVYNY